MSMIGPELFILANRFLVSINRTIRSIDRSARNKAVLTYRALNNLTPHYLTGLLTPLIKLKSIGEGTATHTTVTYDTL